MDDEYETDEDERKAEAEEYKKILIDNTINMAKSFAIKPLYLIMNKLYGDTYDVDELTTSKINIQSTDITCDNVYSFSLSLVPCNYSLDLSKFKNNPIMKEFGNRIHQLMEAFFMTLKFINNDKIKDVHFEQQTFTFYFHYNDQHRIGIICEENNLNDMDSQNLYNSNFDEI